MDERPEALSPFTYLDIVNYLISVANAYTMQEFRNFKSLEAYDRSSDHFRRMHRPKPSDHFVMAMITRGKTI